MRVRLACVAALVAVYAAAVMGVSAPVAGATTEACSNTWGSGSSLQEIVQQKVFVPGFTTSKGWELEAEPHCTAEPTLEYLATSSGTVLKEWGDGGTLGSEKPFPGYGGTDVGPEGPATEEKTQLYKMDHAAEKNSTEFNEVLTVPVAQSAVAVVVSLPAGCTPSATGNEPEVEGLPLEEEWLTDTSALDSFVKNIGTFSGTCTGEPKLEARAKASGTTAGFKRYLDDVNPTGWKTFTETAAKAESNEEWPLFGMTKMNETGNETGGELAKKVIETPNTIGYADLADAVAKGFTSKPVEHENAAKTEKWYSFFVTVENDHKKVENSEAATFASPSEGPVELSTKGANCEKAKYKEPAGSKDEWNEDWSGAKQSNWNTGEQYPICTLTFDVAWHHYTYGGLKAKYEEKFVKGSTTYNSGDAEVAHTVSNYLEYIVKHSQTGTAAEAIEKHQYRPLPANVLSKAEGAPFKEIEG